MSDKVRFLTVVSCISLTAMLCGSLLIARDRPQPVQEIQSYSLPKGMEVRTRHLANTGIVRARLLLSWTEGTADAPIGTAWLLSKLLPQIGCGGMDRAAFESHKDQSGVLSQIEAGRDYIAWTFEAIPANADMMIQLLADEALRPTWTKSENLPELLARTQSTHIFNNAREEAIYSFRTAIHDHAIPRLPLETIGQDRFVSLFSNVRRPKKAVLSIAGEIESIALKRAIYQHFGPWEGIRDTQFAVNNNTLNTLTLVPKLRPKRTVINDGGTPEVWIAWNPDNEPITKPATHNPKPAPYNLRPTTYFSWLLRASLPNSDELIAKYELDTNGHWLRAVGKTGVTAEKLEAHLKSLLINLPLTKELLGKAIKAGNEYLRFNALHPDRALEHDAPLVLPAPDEVKQLLEKCVKDENLTVLVMGFQP